MTCSLDVLYGGLGISKFQVLIKKHKIFFTSKFFSISVIKTLDLGCEGYTNEYSCVPRYQINFGGLAPYLTCARY
jgi:hypothetical protein